MNESCLFHSYAGVYRVNVKWMSHVRFAMHFLRSKTRIVTFSFCGAIFRHTPSTHTYMYSTCVYWRISFIPNSYLQYSNCIVSQPGHLCRKKDNHYTRSIFYIYFLFFPFGKTIFLSIFSPFTWLVVIIDLDHSWLQVLHFNVLQDV